MENELQKELEKMNNEIAKHEDYLKSEKTTYGLADLINGKIPSKQLPSEVNLTANTLDDMNALIASGSVNDGQLCYLKEDKKLYVLKDNVWSEVGGGGGGIPVVIGTKSTEQIKGAIEVYTIPVAQTSCFIFKCDIGIAFVNYNALLNTYVSYFDANNVYDEPNGDYKATNFFYLTGTGTTIYIAKVSFKDAFAARLSNTNYVNGITYYGEDSKLYNFPPPSLNNKYLTYNKDTSSYEWSTPTGGGGVTVTFED